MTQNDLKGFRFRESTRAPFETEVKLRFDRFGGAVSGFAADISMEGMFVRTPEPKPVGTLVQFEFKLGEASELIQGLGDVVWVRTRQLAPNKPPGMGIQFRYVDPHSRELIFKIVDSYLKDAKSGDQEEAPELGSGTQPPPQPPAQPTLEEPATAPPAVSPPPAQGGDATAPPLSPPTLDEPLLGSPSLGLPEGQEGSSLLGELPPLDGLATPGPPAAAADPAPPPAAAPPAEAPAPELPSVDAAPSPPAPALDLPPAVAAPPPPVAPEPPPWTVGAGAAPEVTATGGRPSGRREGELFVPDEVWDPLAAAAEAMQRPPEEASAAPAPRPTYSSAGAGVAAKSGGGRNRVLLLLVALLLFGIAGGIFFSDPLRRALPFIGGDESSPIAADPGPEPEATGGTEPVDLQQGTGDPDRDVDEVPERPAADPGEEATDPVPEPPELEPAPRQLQQAAATGLRRIVEIRTARVRDETVATIAGDGPIEAGSFDEARLESPPRLLLKIYGIEESYRSRTAVGSAQLREIRTGLHPGELHVVFDLASPGVTATVRSEGGLLRVRLSG